MSYRKLESIEITNQCVVICDLGKYSGPGSDAWEALQGTQDEVGARLAAFLEEEGVERMDDFGGVCGIFLTDGGSYVPNPPRIKGRAAVFSFTPRKKLLAEGLDMAQAAGKAGYRGLIITLQKHDKFGKVWVMTGMLRRMSRSLAYYEDTNTVIDELKLSGEGGKVQAIHVKAPGFEAYESAHADRAVDQARYLAEALE